MTGSCDVVMPFFGKVPAFEMASAALTNQETPTGWRVNLLLGKNSKESANIAAARNDAIKKSSADIILFLNADIILRPNALVAHLKFHEQYPGVNEGAIGYIGWDPRIKPSLLQEWMVRGGPQNNFDDLLGSFWVDPLHFFNAAFSSVKRELLNKESFSEEFFLYGWEEHELAERLLSHGFKLAALDRALALHHHHYSVQDLVQRQIKVGRSMNVYRSLSSNKNLPKPSPKKAKKLFFIKYTGFLWIATTFLKMTQKWLFWPWLYKGVLYSYFWQGVFHKN